MESSRILTNRDAVIAQRNLTNFQARFSKSVERLSSGLRLTSAADGASDLAIAEKLDASVRALNQGIRNAQDGLSMFQTAEGTMTEIETMIKRLKELAATAANGTTSDSQRSTLNNEVKQIVAEIDRVASVASFNGTTLFDGSLGVAISSLDTTVINNLSGTADTSSGNLALTVTAATKTTQTTGALLYASTSAALGQAETLTLNGVTFNFTTANTVQDVLNAVNAASGTVQAAASYDTVTKKFTFTQTLAGSGHDIVASGTADFLTANFVKVAGANAAVTAGLPAGTVTSTKDGHVTVTNGSFKGLEFDVLASGSTTVSIGTNKAAKLQVGANPTDYISVTISSLSATSLGLNTADVSTVSGASALLTSADSALDSAVALRAKIGAVGSRLQFTIDATQITVANLTAAHSRIMDVDVAAESTELTKAQVLQTAATAVLAQANQAPQTLLALLR